MLVMKAGAAQLAMLFCTRRRTARSGELAQNSERLLKGQRGLFRHG